MSYFRENPNIGSWGYTFLKNPWNFSFFKLYRQKFQTKPSSTPGYSKKLHYIPWKFQDQKQRPLEIPHFFLVTLGNSTSFLINRLKFHMLSLWYPLQIPYPQPPPPQPPPVWIFLGIAYYPAAESDILRWCSSK